MRASAQTNAWLRPEPDQAPDRQLLVGDPFEVETTRNGWAYGRALKDGYVGHVLEAALAVEIAPTHWVSVRSTWAYEAPDIKSLPVVDLHMTARLQVTGESEGWLEVLYGDGQCYVRTSQCRAWQDWLNDPVEVARLFLGTPYVWAGNTGFGLDCSGLVQVAYHACGLACAADSQDQKVMPGDPPESQEPGDLIFWKDHVAMETGEGTLIHANAYHMSVTEEPRHVVLTRIAATPSGPVSARLRPTRRIIV